MATKTPSISRRRVIQTGVALSLSYGAFKLLQKKSKPHDVIVIGSGAAGGWAAKELSEKGLRVLVVEAGNGAHTRNEFANNPLSKKERERLAKRQQVQARHVLYWQLNPYLFVDDVDNPYTNPTTKTFSWIRGRQLGGRTHLWGGVTLRFSDAQFKAASRDGIGIDWPISYGDLKPHYDKIEKFFAVQGTVENIEQLPDGLFQAHPGYTAAEQALHQKLTGYKMIPCRGIGDFGISALDAARATGRVDVLTDTIVSHFIQDASGRVTSVACFDRHSKQPFELQAPVVASCASTIESVRLLFNSVSPKSPRGIGNGFDQLGRNIMDHANAVIAGAVKDFDRDHAPEAGGPGSFLIPRFQNLNGSDKNFLRGYSIWGWMHRKALVPSFLLANMETLPRPENRVTVSASLKDAWGIPAAHIDMKFSDNERRMGEDALGEMRKIVQLAGPEIISSEFESSLSVPGISVHEMGGARMGADRKDSVLNAVNQCWDAENLFVMDGSCFASSGWQNPTLTIMAIAGRASDAIVSYLKTKS